MVLNRPCLTSTCLWTGTFLKDGLYARCGQYEIVQPLALATLLDPRFKNLGFANPAKVKEAEKQLTLECATLIQPAETSGGNLKTCIFCQHSPLTLLFNNGNDYYHYCYFRSNCSKSSPSLAADSSLWDMLDQKVKEKNHHTQHHSRCNNRSGKISPRSLHSPICRPLGILEGKGSGLSTFAWTWKNALHSCNECTVQKSFFQS